MYMHNTVSCKYHLFAMQVEQLRTPAWFYHG